MLVSLGQQNLKGLIIQLGLRLIRDTLRFKRAWSVCIVIEQGTLRDQRWIGVVWRLFVILSWHISMQSADEEEQIRDSELSLLALSLGRSWRSWGCSLCFEGWVFFPNLFDKPRALLCKHVAVAQLLHKKPVVYAIDILSFFIKGRKPQAQVVDLLGESRL